MKKFEENEKFKQNLAKSLELVNEIHSIDAGHKLLKTLLIDNKDSDQRIVQIIAYISDSLDSLNLNKIAKKENIKLLGIISESIPINLRYVNKILNVMQTNIINENFDLLPQIAETFGIIIGGVYESKISEREKNDFYEIFQSFCISNLKGENKSNQICGGLALASLIENCPHVLHIQNVKNLWDSIINNLEKPNFHAKAELLNSLINLIFATEHLFKQFSTVTLYKILDFLTDNDWVKRKLSLNIIYTLTIYCQEEILPLKEHIVDFLKVLKTDKVKEVRDICLQTLQLFSDLNLLDENVIIDESIPERDKMDKAKEKEHKENKIPKSSVPSIPSSQTTPNSNNFHQIPATATNATNSSPLFYSKENKDNRESTEGRVDRHKKVMVNKHDNKVDNSNNLLSPTNLSSQNIFSKKQKNNNVDDLNTSDIHISKYQKKDKKKSLTPVKNRMKHSNINNITEDEDLGNKSANILKRDYKSNANLLVRNQKFEFKKEQYNSIFKGPANKEFFNRTDDEITVLVPDSINKKESKEIEKIESKEPLFQNFVKENNNFNNKVVKIEKNIVNKETTPTSKTTPLSSNFNTSLMNINHIKNSPKVITNFGKVANSPPKTKIENKDIKVMNKQEDDLDDDNNYNFNETLNRNKYKDFKLNNNTNDIKPNKVDNYNNNAELPDFNNRVEIDDLTLSNLKNETKKSNKQNKPSQKVDLKGIVKQMKLLSEKQIFLIDCLEGMQNNYIKVSNRMNNLEQILHTLYKNNPNLFEGSNLNINNIPNKNNNIIQTNTTKTRQEQNLGLTLKNTELKNNENKGRNDSKDYKDYKEHKDNKEEIEYGQQSNSNNSNSSLWSEIKKAIKNEHIQDAFMLAYECKNEAYLVKLIEIINIEMVKDVNSKLFSDCLNKLIKLIQNPDCMQIILTFFKSLLILYNIEINNDILENLNANLVYIKNNSNLNEYETSEINLILSFISNKKIHSKKKIQSYSNLINSFDKDVFNDDSAEIDY